MASKNITKPEFSEGLALGPILFWIAAIVAIPFLFIWGAMIGFFKEAENTSRPYIEEGLDEFGRKPGDLFYSKNGYMDPLLLDMYENNKKDESY